MNSPRIIFFGTDEFATIVLEHLLENGIGIAAVVTTPDEPAGRKKILAPSIVKQFAEQKKLPILQPATFDSSILEQLKKCNADVAVLAVYGKILPPRVLTLFPKGIINIHPSLLPKYRGPSPIKTALKNGDVETGVTIIKLDEEMDHGPVLAQRAVRISPDEKLSELRDRLALEGGRLLSVTLPRYMDDKVPLFPQDDSRATYTKFITKDDGKIDWKKSADEIYNQFRAFYDWPGVWTEWRGKRLKLLDVSVADNVTSADDEPGKFFSFPGHADLYVTCGSGYLKIMKLQLEGKSPLTDEQFVNGYLKSL